MKRLISILLVAVIAVCLGACDEGAQTQTTVQNVENSQDNALGTSQVSSDADSSMVTTRPSNDSQPDEQTTQSVDIDFNEESANSETQVTTDASSSEDAQGNQSTSSSTVTGEQPTTSPTPSTTNKDETTTTKKTTSSDNSTSSATTKPSTTSGKTTTTKSSTTAKKTTTTKTTTTTKKTTTTTKKTTTTTKKTTTTTQKTTTTTKKTTTTTKKTTISKTVATSFDSSTPNSSKEMFNRVNAERAKRGLPAYIYCPDFQKAADIRAREILQSFSHTRPNGTKWWTADNVEGRCLRGAENIAKGSTDVVSIMNSLMKSESHRASILSTQYTHMVVGYCDGAWVQIFVAPR